MARILWFITTLVVNILVLSSNRCDSQLILKKGAPHLKLDQGFYVGIVRSTRQENYFYEFLGLRYANPPKRFQPPEPLTIHPDAKLEAQHAVKAAPDCPQQDTGGFRGEEDCLFLNVYVPMKKPPIDDGFPVMVWIHGGGFVSGSGSLYDPQHFMDEDVIVVTLNYRLSALGFLSTGDEVVPGNMGLKDQVLALKWVQKNIKVLGGDRKRVTVFGNSAGGASVHFLMLSPLSKGLFHNAIIQSGSAQNFWAYSDTAEIVSRTKRLANALECPVETSTKILECLESKSVEEILTAQMQLEEWFKNPIAVFNPTTEKKGSSDMIFLSKNPLALMESKEFMKIPLMLGFLQDEGLAVQSAIVKLSEKHHSELDTDFLKIAPIAFNYKSWFPQKNLDKVSNEVRKFYFGDKPIDKDTFQNLTNLYSDANFVYGVWKLALSHATEKPVYPYFFTYQDETSQSLTCLITGRKELLGVGHGDELQYLFNIKPYFPKELVKGSRNENFSKQMVKLWASFAHHRKPKATWGSASKWPSISKAQLNGDRPFLWYRIDEDTEIIEDPLLSRKQFWDKLMKKYSKFSEIHRDEL